MSECVKIAGNRRQAHFSRMENQEVTVTLLVQRRFLHTLSTDDAELPAKPLALTHNWGLTKRHAPAKGSRMPGINPERIRDGILRWAADRASHPGRIHTGPE